MTSEASATSPGPWRWDDHPNKHKGSEDRGGILASDGTVVCDFGNGEQYYPTEGESPAAADLALIIASPLLRDAIAKALPLLTRRPDWAGDEEIRAAVKVMDEALKAATYIAPAPTAAPPPPAVPPVPAIPCEWRECNAPAAENRTSADETRWALCSEHCRRFDAAGYASCRVAKAGKS